MPAPLLATKLSIPFTSKYQVNRPSSGKKLLESLNPGCRLALISAPAGYGKTTLISAWISDIKSSKHKPSPLIAWVSLDDRDNDPTLFWSCVIASLQTQREDIGKQSLSLLHVSESPDLEGGLDLLINDLSGIPDPFCLILDDYHLIRNPVIHQSLAFLLEHIPAQFHVIIASRTDPPLPLALLRGRGQLVEIRLNDLRFSTQEADIFLNSGMSLNLSAQAVAALNHKTEGWVTGLQMAGLSLREAASTGDYERIDNFIASFSGYNRYILDYLIEEVINQQPTEIQDFLLRTSILDRLCSPLCDMLSEDLEGAAPLDSQKALEYLDSSNLFIIPLDDQRYWYRYHQLFTDLLRKRLNQLDPSSVKRLHQRAIQWYEQNGLIEKAVHHALYIKDYRKAVSLINQVVEELWGRGEHATLLNWLKALPEEERRKYPNLWVWQVSMLITAGKMQEAERRILEIEEYLSSSPIDSNQIPLMGRVYSLRTYIASFHGDIPNLMHYAQLALENLTRDEDAGGRCGIFLVLSNAYLTNGDLEAANQVLVEAIEAGKSSNRHHMVLTAMSNLATVLFVQGDIKHGNQICQEGIRFVQEIGLEHSPMAANLFIGQGIILCEQGKLDEAEKYILSGLNLAKERNYTWSIAWGYRGQIRLLLSRCDLAAAETVMQEADRLVEAHEIPKYHTSGLSGLKARLWLRLGEIEQAERYLLSRNIRMNDDIQYPHESEFLALAGICLAKGDLTSTANLLERMLSWAETGKHQLWIIRVLVLKALLFQKQGDSRRSQQSLSKAIDLAEPEGCIQTFVDEGEPMRHLLAGFIEMNPHRDYAIRLSQGFSRSWVKQPSGRESQNLHPVEDLSKGGLRQPGKTGMIAPLSERELEVVSLIAEGYSNKEIALKLHVSVRTVKYYTTGIYTKLNVNGRAHAAVKAKELGLLDH